MNNNTLAAAIAAIAFSYSATATDLEPSFGTPLWTYVHTRAVNGQVGEIPAYDAKTHTLWVAGITGVDILDASTGTLVDHIDVTPGAVNSVAIHDGLAALAVEAPSAPLVPAVPTVAGRRANGSVLFYNTRTRSFASGTYQVTVGSLPDMLTFTRDGRTLLVANEGTPNGRADAAYDLATDPPGSVSIIDVARRKVVATAGFVGVPTAGPNIRAPGMDFEPEYITIDSYGRAFVTLQEANAIGVLDLNRKAFTRVIGLGVKDFSLPENGIDPHDIHNDPLGAPHLPGVAFAPAAAKAFYMPDGIAAYQWLGFTFLVMANEGDFREDNVDRLRAGDPSSAGATPFVPSSSELHRLRVSKFDSSAGNLIAAGARSISIRTSTGALVWDSGNTLDVKAHENGVYDDARSADKGVEPEGIALLDLGWKTFAFVGLERTTKAAIAVFDVSNPFKAEYLDMIVTDGDLAPEGLDVFVHRGKVYLAIANESNGVAPSTTTVYQVDLKLDR